MANLNYENNRESGKKLKVHFDLPDDDDYPLSSHKRSSSSVSSASSLDSDDIDKYNNSIDIVDSKYDGYGSPVWSFQGGSVIQSPPSQFMNSPSGYDPNRIPTSVFANRPTSPMEWSVASNESLFSIHLGNNSFSRDNAFAFKSGELPRTDDLVSMPSPLPPVQEVNSINEKNGHKERHSVSSDSSDEAEDSVRGHDQKKTSLEAAGSLVKIVQEKTEASAEVGTPVLDKTPDDHCKETGVPGEEPKDYTSVSYRSMGSDMSTRSFQFPILTADRGRNSSSTVESEKQETSERQLEQLPEEKPEEPPSPNKVEKAPKQRGRNWCFCFSCSPCY